VNVVGALGVLPRFSSRLRASALGSVALAVALGGCSGTPEAPLPEHPDFVVIDVDSLRADRLDRRRGRGWVMPAAHALADRGVRFENAISQGGWTPPALVALLTGRYPLALDVATAEASFFPEGVPTVAALLSQHGYRTCAMWWNGAPVVVPPAREAPGSAPPAATGSLFGAGFERQILAMGPANTPSERLRVYRDWFEQAPDEPFFLFVHDFDIHIAAAPGLTEAIGRFASLDPPCGQVPRADGYRDLGAQRGDEEAVRHTDACYDGAVSVFDEALGTLLDLLDERGLRDRTFVVLVSNHGEVLSEHEPPYNHGHLYDSVLRVPLVIAGPGVGPGGARVEAQVQGIDLAPTLLDLAGVPADPGFDGLSVRPLLGGAATPFPERTAFSLSNARLLSLRTRDDKLVVHGRPGDPDDPERFEHYDLRADPGEVHNDFEARGAALQGLVERLHRFRSARSTQRGERLDLEADALERALRERGYWELAGGAPDPPSTP
jgi:arylsulfatase A-like enzyme